MSELNQFLMRFWHNFYLFQGFIVRNILFLSLIFCYFSSVATAQSNKIIVADFNQSENITNLGESFGAWDKDANDSTQNCKISFAKDDALGEKEGSSLQLDYDVDSPNPAFNGLWLKISKAQVSGFDTFSFYLKGDADKGFTPKIKLELKDKKKGIATFFVENITADWQKISLTLDTKSFEKGQSKSFEEFVIVFDDINSYPKTGRIYIDQIEFSKN